MVGADVVQVSNGTVGRFTAMSTEKKVEIRIVTGKRENGTDYVALGGGTDEQLMFVDVTKEEIGQIMDWLEDHGIRVIERKQSVVAASPTPAKKSAATKMSL